MAVKNYYFPSILDECILFFRNNCFTLCYFSFFVAPNEYKIFVSKTAENRVSDRVTELESGSQLLPFVSSHLDCPDNPISDCLHRSPYSGRVTKSYFPEQSSLDKVLK